MKRIFNKTVFSLLILSSNYTFCQSFNYADSLNMRDVSDAFPFISSDGLRIYYESSRNNSDGSIFYSSRNNTKSYFKAPALLGQQFDGSFGSPTLTSDELTIYVLNSKTKKLFSASRKLRTDAFGALSEVKVLAKNEFYLPAISPNGKQLVVSDYENEYLVFFEQNSKNQFELKYGFENKEDVFKGARFSPNGLQLYAVKKSGAKGGVDDIMVVFSRKTLANAFNAYKYVTTEKNELITDVFASVTKDEKIMAITNNPSNNWNENNIIVYNTGEPVTSIYYSETRKNEVLVYKYASPKKAITPEPIKKQEIVKKADEPITFTGGQNFDDVGYVAPAINTSTPVYQTITTEKGTYVGYAVNGKPNGKGKYTLKSGEVYDGEFSNGNLLGKGKCLYANGDLYEGDWINYLKVGKGKYTFKNGEVYDGDWKNNRREGKGKYTFINGNIHDGQWINNVREGKGKLMLQNGDILTGIWVNGILEGNVSYYTKATNTTKTEVYKNGNLVKAAITPSGRDNALEATLETLHKSSETHFKDYINEQNLIPNYRNFKLYKTTINLDGFKQVNIEKYQDDKTVLVAKNSLPKQEATALFNKLKDALSYYTMFIPGHNPRKEERRSGNLLEYRFAGSNRGEISLLLEQEPFDLDAPVGSAPKFDVIFSIEKR